MLAAVNAGQRPHTLQKHRRHLHLVRLEHVENSDHTGQSSEDGAQHDGAKGQRRIPVIAVRDDEFRDIGAYKVRLVSCREKKIVSYIERITHQCGLQGDP